MSAPHEPVDIVATLFQAHPWHGVPARRAAETFNAFIEIVPTDTVKYEIDKPSGHLRIDRPQRFSNICPRFIPLPISLAARPSRVTATRSTSASSPRRT